MHLLLPDTRENTGIMVTMYIGKAVKNHLSHCFTNGISMTTFSMFIPQMLFFILAIVLCYYAFNKNGQYAGLLFIGVYGCQLFA